MKVTIVMPAYNVERYIERSVRSVLDQTMPDFELIIVDDGSTDMTVSVIKKMMASDPRIRLFQNEHGGSGAARNSGAGKATGKYLYFMDSDDLISRHALAHFLELADTNNADIVVARFDMFTDATEASLDLSSEPPDIGAPVEIISGVELFRRSALTRCWKDRRIFNWLYFFRLDYWRDNNIAYHSFRFYEDLEIYPRFLFPAKRVLSADFRFYHYRLRTGAVNAAHQAHPDRIGCLLDVLSSVENTFREYGLMESMRSACSRTLVIEHFHLLLFISKIESPVLRKPYLDRIDYQKLKNYMRDSGKKKHAILSMLPFMTASRLAVLLRMRLIAKGKAI